MHLLYTTSFKILFINIVKILGIKRLYGLLIFSTVKIYSPHRVNHCNGNKPESAFTQLLNSILETNLVSLTKHQISFYWCPKRRTFGRPQKGPRIREAQNTVSTAGELLTLTAILFGSGRNIFRELLKQHTLCGGRSAGF